MVATTVFKPSYANSAALTKTLASLASTTADPPVGRELGAWDNTSALYSDGMVYGKIMTGTSPTNARFIWVCAATVGYDGSTYWFPAGLAGSDAGKTPDFAGCIGPLGLIVPIVALPTDATSSKSYQFGPISLCSVFGGLKFITRKVGFFVFHNTGVALHATEGNHAIYVEGINGQGIT